MLTSDDSRRDGQKIQYLENPAKWRIFDPDLFDFLTGCISTTRSVGLLEKSSILLNTTYFSDLLNDSAVSRTLYMKTALHDLSKGDLLFFDPDNGMEVKSVPYGIKSSSKYLYWNEVEQAWATGASLLIFQHFNREPRTTFIDKSLNELFKRTKDSFITAIHTSHAAFLFAGQQQHETRFKLAIEMFENRWAGQAKVGKKIHKSFRQ